MLAMIRTMISMMLSAISITRKAMAYSLRVACLVVCLPPLWVAEQLDPTDDDAAAAAAAANAAQEALDQVSSRLAIIAAKHN